MQITPLDNITFELPEPMERCDTSAIHLYSKLDSTWYDSPHIVKRLSARKYEITANWQEGVDYSLEIDSAAVQGIYGLVNKPIKQGIKVGKSEDFSTLKLDITGIPIPSNDSVAVLQVQLLDLL